MKKKPITSSGNQKQQVDSLQKVVQQKKESNQNFIRLKKGFESVKCCSSNRCKLFCYDSQCSEGDGIICDNFQCQCFKKHKNCLLIFHGSVFQHLKTKISPAQEAQKKVDQCFNLMIDQLSRIRDKVADDLRLYGLRPNEVNFWTSVQNGKTQKINGGFLNKIVVNMKKQTIVKEVNSFVQKLIPVIQCIPKTLEAKLDFLSQKKFSTFAQESKIVRTSQEDSTMESFFSQQIKTSKLLYRASEHNFSTDRFFGLCSGIPKTLVIAETQLGKKIGGFAHPAWQFSKCGKDNQKTGDQEKKSFIFSLTWNNKMELKQPLNALSYRKEFGPRFGNDFSINSQSNIGLGWYSRYWDDYNQSFRFRSSHQQFLGCSNSSLNYSCKLKQWEVFQLQFQTD